ncbi:MAG: CSLREA domain-containing protein [Mycobacteriales bacterium]
MTLSWVVHAAPTGGGSRVDVFAASATAIAGYELLATVDHRAATLVGADSRSAQNESAGFHDVSMSGLEDRAVLAAYAPRGSTLAGQVRLGSFFVDRLAPGAATVGLSAIRVVDASGSALDVRGTETRLVNVGAGPASGPAPAGWQLAPGEPRPNRSTVQQDPELELIWQTARLSGQPCAAGVRHHDVTGDGCVDVGDLVVASRWSTGRYPTTQVPLERTSPSSSGPSTTTTAASFTVTTVADAADTNIGNGACRTSAGTCSLRAAIQEANALTGANSIRFAIPGGGVHTIVLTKGLPSLTDQTGGTSVDGYTQPGASPNTDPLIDNARIMVEIKGNGATDFDALAITSAGNTIRGVSMYNARREVWIYGPGAVGNSIVGCFVGTDATGTFVTPAIQLEAIGIKIEQDAPDNRVGGPASADRNVVSGNGRQGIAMWHNRTDRTVIQNNIVGLSPDGTRRVPNRKHGIDLNFGASETVVGGTGPGERNVVSGNDDDGIEVSHTSATANNTIRGNFIGSDVTGTTASAATANANVGVFLEDGVSANLITNNIIVNNTLGGVTIINGGVNGASKGNVIRDNSIGVSANGTALGNGRFGVTMNGSGNAVGPGNVIRFNDGAGVRIDETDASGNTITQNVIADNTGLSIDLSPVGSVNPNDPGDADTGADTKLNFPEPFVAGNGQLTGTTCARCTVEIYRSDAPGRRGPARAYLGSVLADAAGSFTYRTSDPVGSSFTALSIDGAGNTSELALTVALQRSNTPPSINAGADITLAKGESATLTAAVSDPDSTSAVIEWDLDGDGSFETVGNPVQFSTAGITAPATVTVLARATDPGGLSDTDSLVVTVTPSAEQNMPPQARMVVPSQVMAGATFGITLDSLTDSPEDLAAGLSFAFDCGTGYGPAGPAPSTSCPAGTGTSLVVRAKVYDQHGASTQYPARIVVQPYLLANPSFEAGTTQPESWTWTTSLRWVNAPVHNGSRAVASPSTGSSSAVLSQSYAAVEQTRYSLSGYFSVGAAGTGSATFRLRWYDAAGTNISTVTVGTTGAATGTFDELAKSFIAPTAASRAKVEVAFATTGRVIAVDDVVLRRDNQIQNPEFDLDDNADGFPDFWVTQSRFTRSSQQSHLGAYSGRGTGDGGSFTPGQRFDQVVPGQTYVVTAWVDIPPTADAFTLTVRLRWLDASAANTVSAPAVATLHAATPGWTQVNAVLVAPAGAVYGRMEFAFSGGFTGVGYLDSVVVAKV